MLMLLFVAACAFPPGPADAATALRGVVDLAGRPIESLAPKGTRAVVLFFTATDCPLANRYVPQMSALTQSRRGVEVWFVYPNAGDAADLVRAHQAEYRIKSPTALDTGHALSQWARATVTPEAAIFVPDGHGLREIYHGRIDDRYVALGQERPQATHHDLEDALEAALAGRPVSPPGGPAVGCSIAPLASSAQRR